VTLHGTIQYEKQQHAQQPVSGATRSRLAMLLAVIIGVVACFIGWHVSRAHIVHNAIPVRRRQLQGFRRVRTYHLIWTFFVGIVFVLIYLAIFSAH
jgi:hypothetical protein